MRKGRKRGITLALIFTAVTGAGCTANGSGAESFDDDSTTVLSEPSMIVDGSMVKHYGSTEAIAYDSTDLIVGTVVAISTVEIGQLPFTRYEIDIELVLAGDVSENLAVYMVGKPGWQVNLDVPEYLRNGATYAMYLQPTGLPEEQAGGDGHYIVGPAVWERIDSKLFDLRTASSGSHERGTLPASFSESEITDKLSAEAVGQSH